MPPVEHHVDRRVNAATLVALAEVVVRWPSAVASSLALPVGRLSPGDAESEVILTGLPNQAQVRITTADADRLITAS